MAANDVWMDFEVSLLFSKNVPQYPHVWRDIRQFVMGLRATPSTSWNRFYLEWTRSVTLISRSQGRSKKLSRELPVKWMLGEMKMQKRNGCGQKLSSIKFVPQEGGFPFAIPFAVGSWMDYCFLKVIHLVDRHHCRPHFRLTEPTALTTLPSQTTTVLPLPGQVVA